MTTPTCRAALAELVACERMLDTQYERFEKMNAHAVQEAASEEAQRFDAAWAAARAALALEAVPPRVPMEQVREWAQRHDLGISSETGLRDIFDDARTLVAQPQDTKDQAL